MDDKLKMFLLGLTTVFYLYSLYTLCKGMKAEKELAVLKRKSEASKKAIANRGIK